MQGVTFGGRIVAHRVFVGAEQQHAGRNRLVLVSRQRRHAHHLDGQRHAVGGDGNAGLELVGCPVEEGADVAILDFAPEQVLALDHELRAQDGAVAGRKHGANRPGEAHFMRRERPRQRHPQGVAGAEPPHGQGRRVARGFDGQPPVGRGGRHGLGLERGPLEELRQGRLEQAVVLGTYGESGRQRRHRRSDDAIIVHGPAPREHRPR
jgi:hypothetical protein